MRATPLRATAALVLSATAVLLAAAAHLAAAADPPSSPPPLSAVGAHHLLPALSVLGATAAALALLLVASALAGALCASRKKPRVGPAPVSGEDPGYLRGAARANTWLEEFRAREEREAAERAAAEAAARAEAERRRLEAEAEAERRRLEAEAEAEAERLRLEAEAEAERLRFAEEEQRLREEAERIRLAEEEAERARLEAEEAERARLEAEEAERARLEAEEAERMRLEAEAASAAEEEARRLAEEEERRRTEEEARRLAEEEARRRAEHQQDALLRSERERLEQERHELRKKKKKMKKEQERRDREERERKEERRRLKAEQRLAEEIERVRREVEERAQREILQERLRLLENQRGGSGGGGGGVTVLGLPFAAPGTAGMFLGGFSGTSIGAAGARPPAQALEDVAALDAAVKHLNEEIARVRQKHAEAVAAGNAPEAAELAARIENLVRERDHAESSARAALLQSGGGTLDQPGTPGADTHVSPRAPPSGLVQDVVDKRVNSSGEVEYLLRRQRRDAPAWESAERFTPALREQFERDLRSSEVVRVIAKRSTDDDDGFVEYLVERADGRGVAWESAKHLHPNLVTRLDAMLAQEKANLEAAAAERACLVEKVRTLEAERKDAEASARVALQEELLHAKEELKRAQDAELERERAERAELAERVAAELERENAAELERARAELAERLTAELDSKKEVELERERAELAVRLTAEKEAELERERAALAERLVAEEAARQDAAAAEIARTREEMARMQAELERERAELAVRLTAEKEAALERERAALAERLVAEEAARQDAAAAEIARTREELARVQAAELERERAALAEQLTKQVAEEEAARDEALQCAKAKLAELARAKEAELDRERAALRAKEARLAEEERLREEMRQKVAEHEHAEKEEAKRLANEERVHARAEAEAAARSAAEAETQRATAETEVQRRLAAERLLETQREQLRRTESEVGHLRRKLLAQRERGPRGEGAEDDGGAQAREEAEMCAAESEEAQRVRLAAEGLRRAAERMQQEEDRRASRKRVARKRHEEEAAWVDGEGRGAAESHTRAEAVSELAARRRAGVEARAAASAVRDGVASAGPLSEALRALAARPFFDRHASVLDTAARLRGHPPGTFAACPGARPGHVAVCFVDAVDGVQTSTVAHTPGRGFSLAFRRSKGEQQQQQQPQAFFPTIDALFGGGDPRLTAPLAGARAVQQRPVEPEAPQDPARALEAARRSVALIRPEYLNELKALVRPPEPIRRTLFAVLRLVHHRAFTWADVQHILVSSDFIPSIVNFAPESVSEADRTAAEELIRGGGADGALPLSQKAATHASRACGPLFDWLAAQIACGRQLEKERAEGVFLQQQQQENATKGTT